MLGSAPPVALLYRADLPFNFRHVVIPFHPHPHTDLAWLLQPHNFVLLHNPLHYRAELVSPDVEYYSYPFLPFFGFIPFYTLYGCMNMSICLCARAICVVEHNPKSVLPRALGVGRFYSPSFRYGSFSATQLPVLDI